MPLWRRDCRAEHLVRNNRSEERGIPLTKKKISSLVVLTRTKLLPGFHFGGSRKGHDCMVNSAPFVFGQMEESPLFVARGRGMGTNGWRIQLDFGPSRSLFGMTGGFYAQGPRGIG